MFNHHDWIPGHMVDRRLSQEPDRIQAELWTHVLVRRVQED